MDHLDVDRLTAAVRRNPGLTVHTHIAVAEQLAQLGDAVVTVAAGDRFTAGGFPVEAVGGEHAEIYDGLPGVANVGFIIDGRVYHPGDALFAPEATVDTLLVPTSAPWLKLAEAIDFVRAVRPRRAHSIHDAMLSDLGEQIIDRWLNLKGETEYSRIPPGQSVTL